MLKGNSKLFLWKNIRDSYWVYCCGPPKVRHFLRDKSRWLAINSLVSPVSDQLRCNSISWDGTVTRRVTWPTTKVVQNTPCFSTWVWKVDTPNCLWPSILSLSVKLGKQSCSSQTWFVSLRRLQESSIEGFTFCILTRNIVISILASFWMPSLWCYRSPGKPHPHQVNQTQTKSLPIYSSKQCNDSIWPCGSSIA